jgi:hypothetical protein
MMEEQEFTRRIAIRSPFGSENYNLKTETSDTDYRVVVYPTMDDLYSGVKVSKCFKRDGNDYNIVDVREFWRILQGGHPTNLETLYFPDYTDSLFQIITDSEKDDIVRANLWNTFQSTIGNISSSMRVYLSESSAESLKKESTAYRLSSFLYRFYKQGFIGFKEASQYHGDEKEIVMGIKLGTTYPHERYLLVNEMVEKAKKTEIDYKNFNSIPYRKTIDSISARIKEWTIYNLK